MNQKEQIKSKLEYMNSLKWANTHCKKIVESIISLNGIQCVYDFALDMVKKKPCSIEVSQFYFKLSFTRIDNVMWCIICSWFIVLYYHLVQYDYIHSVWFSSE